MPKHAGTSLALLLASLFITPVFSSPTDPISGQQLLGQSFGVPGVNLSYDYVIVGGGTAEPLSSLKDTGIVFHINSLSDPRNQEVLIAAFRRAREIFADKSLEAVLVGEEVAPGNATQSDEDILAYIHKSAQIFFHASSTCKMGKKGDSNAVVDPQGRVFGVESLRVVDLSAVPFLPPGHPMATVYALAEKQATAILGGS